MGEIQRFVRPESRIVWRLARDDSTALLRGDKATNWKITCMAHISAEVEVETGAGAAEVGATGVGVARVGVAGVGVGATSLD